MVDQEKPAERAAGTAGQPTTEEHASDFAGVPDGFQRLWTPHRMVYIRGDRPSDHAGTGCPFCAAPDKDDAEGLMVHRGETCYVVLNLFPYNPGHLLICPYRHVPLYTDLTPEETVEFGHLTQTAMSALTKASAPAGYNIGMNQGEVAGAGVAAHLHQHVVPRWGGDMNFLPVIGQTKAVPTLLEDARQALLAAWPA
ncbi:HIT family protein [Ornithinimicrobium cavernae]|uniref:HIT family protein n=1 Tax=Ornithinimicrobium cavernae TaxID=2666047 RepID=UPI000D69054B|nr:HIT domain-containing protein [Ornithinimicrobium cavernae]